MRSSVMRSAGLPVLLIGAPINFNYSFIGSPDTRHFTRAQQPLLRRPRSRRCVKVLNP